MGFRFSADKVRSLVFGVEDSLVSTVGVVAGVAAANASDATILLTGTVLVFVEAFSMAVGTVLSDTSAHEFSAKHSVAITSSFGSAAVMFGSYIICGFLVLAPYILFDNGTAIITSIILSLIALFALGVISATLSRGSAFRKGITMLVIGGAAIVLGTLVGSMFSAGRY